MLEQRLGEGHGHLTERAEPGGIRAMVQELLEDHGVRLAGRVHHGVAAIAITSISAGAGPQQGAHGLALAHKDGHLKGCVAVLVQLVGIGPQLQVSGDDLQRARPGRLVQSLTVDAGRLSRRARLLLEQLLSLLLFAALAHQCDPGAFFGAGGSCSSPGILPWRNWAGRSLTMRRSQASR